ncbi:(2Fe-2S)-binding protein [Streptomyces sp. NPDC001393]
MPPARAATSRAVERQHRPLLAAVEAGARDLEGVREATGANTGCGDCAHDIEDLIADMQEHGAPPAA